MNFNGNKATALQVIESLRFGIPPSGHIRYFTVGRADELSRLENILRQQQWGALLIQANYGSGKSHLLRFAGETALSHGYIISHVTVDANSGVRFNRMDQIVAAILRGIEIPDLPSRQEFSGNVRHYLHKISELGTKRDRYDQAWYYLNELHQRSMRSSYGFKGLVILFDEFEDVLTNLRDIRYQNTAFQNLFRFYQGTAFQGMSFFAVTPEFCRTSERRISNRGCWNSTYAQLYQLPTFQMSPITVEQLYELARRIRHVHKIAYDWVGNTTDIQIFLDKVVQEVGNSPVQDRSRLAISEIVKRLDNYIED